MTEILRPDLCVIGGGPGGMAAARIAAQRGAKVVLVDKRSLGGSAHLRPAWHIEALSELAARVSAARASSARFGLSEGEARIDFNRLRRESQAAMERFLRADSPVRLAGLGVRIVQANGAFSSPSRFEAGDYRIEARRFLLALEAAASSLPVPGIELIRPLTADRIGDLTIVPKKLLVVGAGRDGLVISQAFLRLGAKVILLQETGLLPDEDPELVAPLRSALIDEGMEIRENVKLARIELPGSGLQATGLRAVFDSGETIDASHLLHAEDRLPLVEGLGLKKAHVSYGMNGPQCDSAGRSSNPRIYAIHDGHESLERIAAARYEAEFVVAALFGEKPLPPMPTARIIGTDPEIATIGLSEEGARAKHKRIGVLRAAFCDNLRAQMVCQRAPHSVRGQHALRGHVKIITDSRGHLLGASIIGPQARELIGVFGLGLAKRLKAEDLAAVAAGGPSLMEICRTAGLASLPQTGKAGKWRLFGAWRSLR